MELPEAEVVCRQLQEKLAGRRLNDLHVHTAGFVQNPDRLDLRGLDVRAVRRMGKLGVISLSRNGRGEKRIVALRFGMTGQLRFQSSGETALNHTHVRFVFGASELHFRDARRFGKVVVFGRDRWEEWARSTLGPDPFEVDPGEWAARVRAHRAPIKHILLNQKIISGVGNIYSDEALFEAGIHPLALGHRLPVTALKRLHSSLTEILRRAIASGGSTISDFVDVDGHPGRFQEQHQVYGKFRRPCPKCGRPLQRVREPSRSFTYCEKCQRRRPK
ncbi:MAG: bifunctional DNA-formamidopyrimidine glycosylase/DNA-(apurinic or apyrimidinic site) lyase [Nitrospirae bacterium]|nr:bifunctional DNA-formamidopyrimidine glycosylase/DNA-(apurinic or apyrimidinic site) lyase [Nitrospirota bacterium]